MSEFEYDNEPEGDEEASSYQDEVKLPDLSTVVKVTQAYNANGTVRKILRAKKSDFVANLIYLDGKKFSFEGRHYLKPIYDRDDKHVLLKTARQVEKCSHINSLYLTHNGRQVIVRDLSVGDELVSFDAARKATTARVIAIEPNGIQPLVRVTTKKHRSTTCTLNHPILTLSGWVDAGALTVGAFIGLPHSAGMFGGMHAPIEAETAGLLLAEGTHCGASILFFQDTGPCLAHFLKLCRKLNIFVTPQLRHQTKDSYSVRINCTNRSLYDFISPAMAGRRSASLAMPGWAYELDSESCAAFIRGLWAGDGHCKNVRDGRIDLCYSSVSKELIYSLQCLLLKFGIFSTIRENKPTLYKGEGDERLAYILRVIGDRSIRAFHDKIGPIVGKPFTLEKICDDKDQSDIIPKEVGKLIKQIIKERGPRKHGATLFTHGLRNSPGYNMQRDKFLRYCEFLDDQRLWDIYHADVYWDRVESVETLPPEETFAVEMETHHNFVTDGIITHNTTFLANNLVVTSAVKPYAKSLYVSPSHTQTRQFSNEKLRPALEKSPIIAKYFQDTQVSSQVFEKGCTNGSYIFLRSAFRSADRTRGISVSEILALDEIQDFLGSEIPVILECTSHYPNSRILMAGTPKSNDNPIELAWKDSTQNEWMVPCRCGKFNFLDETCIGPTELYVTNDLPPGPICKKCKRPLNVKAGRWESFNKNAMVQSYRICQLQVDWMITLKSQWMRLLHKRDTYATGQLYNEVLGLSYDNASKPITRDALMEACRDYSLWDPNHFDANTLNESKRFRLYGGVDWGEGLDGSEKSTTGKTRNASYTVLTVGGYINSTIFRPMLIKRYEGKEVDPDYVTRDITRIVRALGVQLTGVDHGHGWGVNNTLVRYLGPNKVVMMQHLAKLKQKLKYDPIGMKYMLQRNFVMSEIFFDIKQGFIEFPKWAQFERFGKDILAIFAEYCDYRREIKYDHKASDPDDFFHSLLFCKLAADIHLGKSRRYTANIDSTPDEIPDN